MHRTWRPADSARRRSPTARAVAPPTPASTSSNTTVGEPSTEVAMLISASITRDSSPPEATSRSGPGATPGFGPIRNSTESPPAGPKRASGPSPALGRSSITTSNVASAIASSPSSAHTAFASAPAALAAARAQARRQLVEGGDVRCSSSCSSRAVVSPAFASRSRSARQRSACSSTASIVPPCLRFSRASCSRRSSTTARRPGSASTEPR